MLYQSCGYPIPTNWVAWQVVEILNWVWVSGLVPLQASLTELQDGISCWQNHTNLACGRRSNGINHSGFRIPHAAMHL